MKSDFCILVLSCDKYADLWKPFFIQFRRYMRNNPYPVYLGSNTVKYPDSSVQTILSGHGKDWSTDLLSILSKIKEKYIFIWIDDFFPIKHIEPEIFVSCFRHMKETGANHMHMNNTVKPDGTCSNSLFGYYEKKAPYRVSVSGFWNTEHLKRLLIPGENPWKFEIMGSYRSSYYDGYYGLNKPLFEFIRVVEKGRINRDVYEYCLKHGIELDISKRGINGKFVTVMNNMKDFFFRNFVNIPWKLRLGLMDIFRKILISY